MILWHSRAWHERKAKEDAARAAEIARLRAIEDARETTGALIASVGREIASLNDGTATHRVPSRYRYRIVR